MIRMTSQPSHHDPVSARALAAALLQQGDPRSCFITDLLQASLPRIRERQRCTDLVMGTLRNRTAIDRAITAFGGCDVQRISDRLLPVIRIAVYELLYCAATAAHAIVYEAGEVVKRTGGGKQVGFVNQVLRSLGRHITQRQGPLAGADPQRVLPCSETQGCIFDEPFLPDPEASPDDYLACCFSLPVWLVQTWVHAYGHARAYHIGLASNRRPSTYLRANTLKTSRDDLLCRLASSIPVAEPVDHDMIRLRAGGDVSVLEGFAEGLFSIQDHTSARVAKAADPQSHMHILDLCAAPGGKTTHLAELTCDQARILATDINPDRLQRLKQNVRRLDIHSVTVVEYHQVREHVEQHGGFDLVLLDVPCSNTGVLARRPEVRYRLRPKDIQSLCRTQRELLEEAVTWSGPDCRIVYSTCSILPEENEALVRVFVQERPALHIRQEQLILPQAGPQDHDGGYIAVLDCRGQA